MEQQQGGLSAVVFWSTSGAVVGMVHRGLQICGSAGRTESVIALNFCNQICSTGIEHCDGM